MANVTIQVQSLLNAATYDSYTLADTTTVANTKAAINSAVGTDSSWYALYYGGELLQDANTLASYGITTGIQIRSANKISRLPTLEDRQKAKLALASLDRVDVGYARAAYDITQLPTQFSGNVIYDNPNVGGLVVGRPWIERSYTIGTIPSSINEGSAGTLNVTTLGVADGTTLYWTIETRASDFATSSGSFTVTSNAGSFTVTPTADLLTEGIETFTVAIRTDSTSGTIVATTATVDINDTSI